jgi:hypothetical protein
METPSTFYFYKLPLSRRIAISLCLSTSRIGLFLFSTSFRYPGSSLAIASLLLSMGTIGEPLAIDRLDTNVVLGFLPRACSILFSLVWLSILLCRFSLQLAGAGSWKQQMSENEERLRYRVSALEDWLVLPARKSRLGAIEVAYRAENPRFTSR